MSHGHSHGGHGHSHGGGGGGGHGHSHGGPGSEKDTFGPEQGIFDGYTVGDQNQVSRTPKYYFQADPQVKRALLEAQRTQSGKGGKKGKKGGDQDHGHSHGGDQGESMLEAQPTEQYLEQYCYSGYLAHVMLLHAQGVDVKRIQNANSDTEGATSLMWAALNGHLPIVKFLHQVGVDVNVATKDGQTALHWAVTEGHYEVVRFLHEVGADFEAKDVRGFDAYSVAIQQDNFPMLVFLHELRPMSPETVDADGHTYSHWCAYRNNVAALEYVHNVVKTPIDAVDKQRRTPLHWAAREGAVECIVYLLSNGLLATVPDADGTSPITHAVARGHTRAAQLMRTSSTKPISYMTSTLSLISTKRGLALAATPFVVLLGFFIATMFLPPIICFFIPSIITIKNPIVHRFSTKATRATVAFSYSVTEQPRDMLAALRGTWLTRRREPYLFALWMALIFYEYVAYNFYALPLPPLFLPLVGLTFFAALMMKRNAYGSVVLPKTLQHSDLVKAAKERRTELLNARQMDVDRHARLPLRASYCLEIDRYLRRYDSWSLLLDAPISAVNHHWFVYFVLSLAASQAYIAAEGFRYVYFEYCADICSKAFPLLDEKGVVASLAYLVTGGIPCRDTIVSVDSYYGMYRPTPMNSAAPFIWIIPAIFAFLLVFLAIAHLRNASYNITRAEQIHPYAMSSNGKVASIFRAIGNKGETLYGSGSRIANVVMFMLGRQTAYVRSDEYEIPAPASGAKLFSLSGSSGGCCGGH